MVVPVFEENVSHAQALCTCGSYKLISHHKKNFIEGVMGPIYNKIVFHRPMDNSHLNFLEIICCMQFFNRWGTETYFECGSFLSPQRFVCSSRGTGSSKHHVSVGLSLHIEEDLEPKQTHEDSPQAQVLVHH